MTDTYNLNLAQDTLSDALANLRVAQRYILITERSHPYLADRIVRLINAVHKLQGEVSNFIELDTTLARGGEK